MQTIAIIPARGGSTRIPYKNIAPLGDHPLLAHTVMAAQKAKEVDAVFVSTDDREIGAVAQRFGAQVVWRPDELATSTAPTEPALIHAVTEIEKKIGGNVERIVFLQATSPLRNAARIDEGVRLLRESGCDSVISVVKDINYYFLGDVDENGLYKVGFDPLNRLRTQDIPPRYRENGALYVMTRRQLMEGKCRMGGKMRALVMEEWESLDIDTPLELEMVRFLVERGAVKL